MNNNDGRTVTVAPAGRSGKAAADPAVRNKTIFRTHTINTGKKTAFPIGIVFGVIIITLLFMTLVSNYVAINEYTKEVAELSDSLEDLKNEEKRLNNDLSSKINKISAKDDAYNERGLVGASEIEKKYVQISEDEKIEVYEVEEDGTLGAITSAMFALFGNLVDNWNTLVGNE